MPTSSLPDSGSGEPDPIDAGLEKTIFNLARFRINKNGALERIPLSKASAMSEEICGTFQRIFERRMEVSDITPETLAKLADHFPACTSSKRKACRRNWFAKKNFIASTLGWSKRFEFETEDHKRKHATPKSFYDEEMDDERALAMGDLSLRQLLYDHYIPKRLVGKSKRTVTLYLNSINAYGRWLERPPRISDLTDSRVTGFLQWCLDNTDLSRHSIQKHRTQLVVLWNFCAKRRWTRDAPDIPVIPCPERIPDAWSMDEMRRIMDACKAARGRVGHVNANLFWPALISFVFDTAERIGAVLEVRRCDLSGEWITVRGEFRKGGKRDARYKLRKETLELLESIKVEGQELIFHWPLDRNYIYNRFGRLLEAAELPNTPRNKFHKIRRTTASFYQAAGCDATRLLGHSNQRVTKASYLDPSIVKTAQPADIVAGIGQAPTEKPREETDSQEELLDQFREFLRQKGSSS